ncbi:MAG TPA: serine hydrolase domain-containing protein [Gemmatimonadales bacterium]|nr:serine hydrolase domain-containing protein [Gemmatimonadales bacterium]
MMHLMASFRRSTGVTILLSLAAVVPLTAQAPFEARVDSIAGAVLEQTGVPSASVAVVRDGRVVYAHAYGNSKLDPATPAEAGLRYSIGSISKQFAASCILLLQQDGKLSLDDKVSRWFPDLTRANEVTIRQLLSHTSGYQDYWPQDYVPPPMLRPITARGIMDQWAKKPLDFDPGTRWQYSNTNYVIAGAIVEQVSGMPFFDFLRTRILAPLGLASARDIDVSHLTEPEATGYMRYALGPLHPAPKEAKGWLFAMGELSMTAGDLAKWDISLMDQSLLMPASYHELGTEVLLDNGVGTGYGLGVDVGMFSGHRMIAHSGEVSGFTAQNMVFPDDRAAVAVLTNQDAAPAAGAIAGAVSRLLFTGEDAETSARVAQARGIFEGLQKGKVDRSLFTDDANAYFSDLALHDFAASLAPLGTPTTFTQTRQSLRGGMVLRVFSAVFPDRTLRVWTFQMPDGKLEQYQVSPVGG